MDILIPVCWVLLYFFIGTFFAILIDGKDGEHLIGFATFWPVILAVALLFIAVGLLMVPFAIAEEMHKRFFKKK